LKNDLNYLPDFFRALSKQKEKTIIVFEDIHWADEATLDFIKFFARRITTIAMSVYSYLPRR
jgi:predicted ATPase